MTTPSTLYERFKLRTQKPAGIFFNCIVPVLVGITLAFFGWAIFIFVAMNSYSFRKEYNKIFCDGVI